MIETSFKLGVVMERRQLADRWQSVQWRPIGLDLDAVAVAPPEMIDKDASRERWLYPGLELRLYRDEAEGYFLNCSAEQPVVFIAWRIEDQVAHPWFATASYNEASRMLDSSENVEGVSMPSELFHEISAFVTLHYKGLPKKRSKPPSFKGAFRDE